MRKNKLWFKGALALGATLAGAGCSNDASPTESAGTQTSPLYQAPLDAKHPFDVGVCAGRLNTDPKYGEVGSCAGLGLGSPDKFNVRGSGTLITPNLVLTVRHAFRELDPPPPVPFECTYGLGDMFFTDGIQITTDPSTIVNHPSWVKAAEIIEPAGNVGCTDDIALLRLEHNVTDVKPAWVDLNRDLGKFPPRKVAVVGRGMVSSTDQGDLLRRFLTDIPFTCAKAPCELHYTQGGKDLAFHVQDGTWAIAGSLLPGDSGSGLLLNESFDWRPTLIGVGTSGLVEDNGIPKYAMGVALYPNRTWIAHAVREAARIGQYPVPAWAL